MPIVIDSNAVLFAVMEHIVLNVKHKMDQCAWKGVFKLYEFTFIF